MTDDKREQNEREGEEELVHAHMHQHADGIVHSHYHRHPGGSEPHEHFLDDETPGVIVFDPIDEDHEEPDIIPVHEHQGSTSVNPPLRANGVSYSYPHVPNPVFTNMDVEAQAGSMLAILGNNGAGKSTLLDLLAGITRPSQGTIRANDEDLTLLSRRQIAQRIAYVAQQQTVPHLSVYDEVLLGRKPHISWSIAERDRQIVARAIAGLGLAPFAERFCDELSGGERQKVFIARALAQEPSILILDEPTSALDPKNQIEVLRAIHTITREDGLATVLVLHDINLALRFCDCFLLMRDGEVVSQGGAQAVTEQTLCRTYDTEFRLIEIDGVRMAVPCVD